MPPQGERPNVLVITTDQQRYDTLGAMGNGIVQTPNLDTLAGRGVLFSNAYVQNPICIPSRACLHTGRYIHQHGVQYMEEVIDTTPPLPPWEKTFMERLQEAGYVTGAVGKIHMMQPKGYDEMALTGGKGARWTRSEGLPIGPAPLHYVNPTYDGPTYKEWLEARHPGGYEAIYEQRRCPEYREHLTAIINVLPAEEYVDTWIASQAIDFLQRHRDSQPFFLWIGFCGPHGPLDPPRSYAERYPIDAMPLPKTYLAALSDKPAFLQRRRSRRLVNDPSLARRCIAYYYALITLIDDQIGRIWATLEANGLAENTLLLFTSDHGDMLGDFGMMGKSNFYEPVIHVPALLVPPARWGRKIRRFDGLVETMSLAPTVLDYAGIDPPPEMTAKSWRSLVEGRAEGETAILCEFVSNDRRIRGKCVRTERYKLVSWGPEGGELYDLQEDPLELCNRYDDPAYLPVRDAMKDILLERLAESETPPYTQWLEKLPEHVASGG